ncbi:precorrin-6y C5,15-methyltransferase (decarboxylating) subunit CbiE [Paraburkholderia sp.]|uniref:precorrin-6y C5,15-methyltransferase (decarboxylating) subunit CbiE n=1 Tax=Paraburkholderia sp. TaxID=1926495 RepID=UPI00239ED4B3|nr:precorrin-6y C5,15-methyltransferase (decarboxylating) subunit CbiE [Paraburkholderia sp.]MDE1181725.1 precorrin-6y C5,15-methyltransferase (decarboxylating) subunit CbiE [Paraburkholderia sp.]
MPAWLTVVGIGEDGYAGLGRAARRALLDATVVIGGERHLAMLPARIAARREAWPRPFDLAPLLARRQALNADLCWHASDACEKPSHARSASICVLASGDPMLFGVGATLARQLPPDELCVLPAPSSLSLAAARLGWPLQDVQTVSLVGRPLATLNAHLRDGARIFVLSADGSTPASLAAMLTTRGFGSTRMAVLEHLGGALERRIDGCADQWSAHDIAALNVVALECRASDGAPRWPLTPGLPDDAFRHDGQLTKRDVRAITLARLAPAPGELLWDIGAGSGSIGIEWMRVHPSCRAIAVESHPERQRFIEHNRDALGVPGLQLVAGRAPDALDGLATPDAIFIGGGVTTAGTLDACWSGLRDGGRLVANAVTLQGEAALVAWREQHGGTLTRIALAEAQPLGGFDTWRQALPITLLDVRKPHASESRAKD